MNSNPIPEHIAQKKPEDWTADDWEAMADWLAAEAGAEWQSVRPIAASPSFNGVALHEIEMREHGAILAMLKAQSIRLRQLEAQLASIVARGA